MIVDHDNKLIVAIIAQGKGVEVTERLFQEKGITDANVTPGRGRGAAQRGRFGVWDEVDMVAVVVPSARATEIFEFLYDAGEVGRPKGGIVFQHPVTITTRFNLPKDLPMEGAH
jgi:nitrogen regulatory protein PII